MQLLLPFSLKFLKVKIFEGFEGFCLVLSLKFLVLHTT